MWPFKRKLKQRRLEVRKGIQTAGAGWWRRFRTSVGVVPLLLTWVFFIGALLLDAWPLEPLTYRENQFIPANIYARVPFDFFPPQELREAFIHARKSAPGVFRLNAPLLDEIVDALTAAPETVQPATQPSEPTAEASGKIGLLPISPDRADAWKALAKPDRRTKYTTQIGRLRDELVKLVIVAPEQRNSELDRQDVQSPQVLIDFPTGRESKETTETLIGTDNIAFIRDAVDKACRGFDASIRPDVRQYLQTVLTQRALYLRDDQASQEQLADAAAAVRANPPRRPYDTDDLLVARTLSLPTGIRRGLSSDGSALLEAEHLAYRLARHEEHRWSLLARGLGRAAILMTLTLVMGTYILRYWPRIVANRWRALAMVCLMLGMLAASKAIVLGLGSNPHAAVLPLLMATLVLVIAYDQRFALVMSLLLAMFMTLQLRASFSVFVVMASATACCALLLQEIRSRSRLLEVTGIAAGVVFVIACGLGLTGGVPWRFVRGDALWAAGMALLAGVVVQVILPLIERAFNIATSMTLLEWCDASKPLLKRLAMEAPGTYNHSLQLGTMCEAAAEAIGAGGLLARVGAYYHDVGKINKPRYFVENGAGSTELHGRLSPEMSMLIIAGHVKDGVEMAREYGLPGALHPFIATHHGTTVVQYFYHAATEQRKNGDDRVPAESEFRYPGPKPRSREAGILMLADAAESSVRAMKDPTPTRIESQVHVMVNRRLMDGQLEQCDLTLREAHEIEQSLVKSLCAIYHARIAYPKPADEETPAPAEQGAD
ncbi:hypothetical protein LCGC14_0868280 [marine sediment metagenome]|uniref:HD/PDEase domain-containing protein n=1 Tax=marine sediment metagenome TaxID=412755 RepID=A0A0F9RQ24_9ZZZZ|nr:HDIG domain-containing protein [Phycisphaerae bacterium]HDZ44612.1 HDIG domain-containing protein [Phycisphaerae bacterium]